MRSPCPLPPFPHVDNHPLSTEPLASPPCFCGRASVIAWECCWLSTESGEKRGETSSDVRGGGVICTLQIYRVSVHRPMGLLYRGSTAPITGVKLAPHSRLHETRGRFIGSPRPRGTGTSGRPLARRARGRVRVP